MTNTDLQNAVESKNDVPSVSVIIVSYNTRDMTLGCLRTLFDQTRDVDLDVWVVDNASRDGSCDAIRQEFSQVHVIENPDNAGFGAANNRALTQARGDWFLLLNSDAFVQDGAIQTMVEYAQAHPQVGVVGPKLLNKDGSLQRSCYRFPGPLHSWLENLWIASLLPSRLAWSDLRRWAHDEERLVDWVSGACFLVRREAWEKAGGFDERFFMYAEETDWQRSIVAQGWSVAFVPQAVVTHWGGASGANSDVASERARINDSFFQSLDYYEWKHHGPAGLVSVRAAMTVGCLLRTVLWTMASLLPAKRKMARSKSKFQAWLVWRQLTQWKVPLKDKTLPS